MGKNATRNDVAKLAGVSPAVVSYVINKTKFVSEEKTQAVLDAIKELNYQPNLYARSLKTNRSMQIAFVCDNLRNDWLEIAEKKLDKLGYNVSHCYSRDGDDFIQSLISGRYDAVFMMSNRYKAEQLNYIAKSGIPVVLFKTREYSHLESNIIAVAPNLYSGVEKTVNYLVFRGHQRILFVPPLRYNMHLNRGYRERGYRDALEANGIPYDERYVCTNADTMEGVLSHVFDMVFSKSKDERATAVIAGNDFIAASIMQYVKKLGMKIPDDLAVVGADNTFIAEIVSPTLTSRLLERGILPKAGRYPDGAAARRKSSGSVHPRIPLRARERVGRQRTTTLPNTPPSYKFTDRQRPRDFKTVTGLLPVFAFASGFVMLKIRNMTRVTTKQGWKHCKLHKTRIAEL